MRHVPSRRPSGTLVEDRCIIDHVQEDRDRTPEQTPTILVYVAQIHRDVDAVLLHKKDLRRVDNEEVLVVRVDVWRLVKGHVREHVDVRVRLCER